ncbi:MAG: tetratricopeptide repeat protein [Bryobacter sp.]|nr:tetratricopeptide repeat protein [Bryobacter sp.]
MGFAELIAWLLLFSQPNVIDLARHYEAEYRRVAAAKGQRSAEAAKAADDLGRFLLREGQAAAAVDWFSRALAAEANEERQELLAEALRGARRTECIAVYEALAAKALDPARVARAYTALADLAQTPAVAIAFLRKALEKEASVARWNDLGLALRSSGKNAEAIAAFRRALPPGKQSADPEAATTRNNLASALLEAGKLIEAESEQRLAWRVLQDALGPGHVRTGLALSNLADIVKARGREQEARRMYQEAYETFRTKLGDDHAWTREAAAAAKP